MKTTIEAMEWRYATKKFDPKKKISAMQLEVLLETLRLAPSSYGLQPWKFVVVTNDEIRVKLRAASWDQPQVTDASHLIVFTIKKNLDVALVDEYMQLVAKVRHLNVEDLKGFADMIKGRLGSHTEEQNKEWATRQVYLSLGTLLAAAALEGVDACPIEGFDPAQFDEILGLTERGLESKVVVAVGFRSSEDTHAGDPKVRFSKEETIIQIQ